MNSFVKTLFRESKDWLEAPGFSTDAFEKNDENCRKRGSFLPKSLALILRIKQPLCAQNCAELFMDLIQKDNVLSATYAYGQMESPSTSYSDGHIMLSRKLDFPSQTKLEDTVVKLDKNCKHGGPRLEYEGCKLDF